MTRIQFWTLTYLSSLVVVLLFLQIIFIRITAADQARFLERQRFVADGQSFDLHVRQVAARIYQVSQQTQDQGLRDILVRQHVSIAPPPDGSNNAPAAAPATH